MAKISLKLHELIDGGPGSPPRCADQRDIQLGRFAGLGAMEQCGSDTACDIHAANATSRVRQLPALPGGGADSVDSWDEYEG